MEIEDETSKPKTQLIVGENIETLSLEELNLRIEKLKNEIVRTQATLEKKSKFLLAAEGLFAKK